MCSSAYIVHASATIYFQYYRTIMLGSQGILLCNELWPVHVLVHAWLHIYNYVKLMETCLYHIPIQYSAARVINIINYIVYI